MKLALGLAGLAVLVAAGAWMLQERQGLRTPTAVVPEAGSPGSREEDPGGLRDPDDAIRDERTTGGGAPSASELERSIHGRVIERSDGSGVTGARVWLEDERGELLQETRSRGDGSFELGAVSKARRVRVEPSPVYLPGEAPLVLTSDQRAGTDPVTVAVTRARRGRVRGLVLDPRGQPVPWFAFGMIDAADTDELLTTDAEGRFESTQSFREGAVQIRGWEAPWVYPELTRAAFDDPEWPFDELAFAVSIGPRVELCLSGPGALSTDLRALLLGTSDPGANINLVDGTVVRREGERPWVRFREAPSVPGPPWQLRVGDPHRAILGKAELAQFEVEGCVNVHLRERLELIVRVEDPDGFPVHLATVELLGANGQIESSARTRRHSEGTYQAVLTDLAPGRVRIRVRKPGWSTYEEDVELPHRLVECVLEPRVDLGVVSGTLVVEEETQRDPIATLIPLHPGGQLQTMTGMNARVVEGRTYRPFRFENVPPGRYRIEVTHPQWMVTEPDPYVVLAPIKDLEIPVRPISRGDELWLDLHLEGGEDPDALHFHVRRPTDSLAWSQTWVRPERTEPGGPFVIEGVPDTGPLLWTVLHEGYRPVSGTLADFQQDGDRRRVRIDMVPGWGRLLWATSTDTYSMVEGVTVLADGEVALVTDPTRPSVLSLRRRPDKLSLAPGPWQLEPGGNVDPRSGAFFADDLQLQLQLVRGE